MDIIRVFRTTYPVYGFGIRAMTADAILKMQHDYARAMQQAYEPHSLSYLGLAQYQPQKPLDERFADFKLRLAEAMKKHGLDKFNETTTNQATS